MRRLCTADDLFVFANSSGNHNPLHLPHHDGDGDGQKEAVAPSMWVGSLISALLGNKLPGPGTFYKTQVFRFLDRVHAGQEVGARRGHGEGTRPPGAAGDHGRPRRGRGAGAGRRRREVIAPERKLTFDDTDVPGPAGQTPPAFRSDHGKMHRDGADADRGDRARIARCAGRRACWACVTT
jgi:acyl dehydratase